MFVNESTAGKIGSEYQKMTGNAVKTTAFSSLLLARLLRSILERAQHQKEGLVEIKINGKLVFKGKEGEKPQVNKLTSEHMQLLEKIINTNTKPTPDISLSVDGKTLYETINGQEKINNFTSVKQNNNSVVSIEQPSKSSATGLASVLVAKRVLDSRGVNVFENDVYRLERQQGSLKITAKDGRGDILNWEQENSTGKLVETDIQVEDLKALEAIDVPTRQHTQTVNVSAVEIERE